MNQSTEQQTKLAANVGERYARRYASMTLDEILSRLVHPNSPLMQNAHMLQAFRDAFTLARDGGELGVKS